MAIGTSTPEKKKAPLPLIIGGVLVVGGIAAFFIFHNSDDDSLTICVPVHWRKK